VSELALLLLTAFWGSTFWFTKHLLASTSASVFLALRFGLAAAVVGGVWLARRSPRSRGLLRDGVWLGIAMACGFLLQTQGLRYTTPARSGFLTGLTVLFVPLIAHFVQRRPVGRATWAGVALALLGLAVLTRPFDGAVGPAVRLGDALTVGCAIAFALHILYTSEWAARHALAPLLLVQIVVTGVVAGVVPMAFEGVRVGPRGELVAMVVYMGLVMTVAAFFIQTWAQRRVSGPRAALIFALEPVSAALIAAGWGGDHIAAAEWLGGGMIVAGVAAGAISPGRDRSRGGARPPSPLA
jgi:drug/metabolite transporter (DMT)-like permease